MDTEPLLIVDNLRVEFDTPRGTLRAVDGISITANRGEAIGIVGESGSGKSMTALSLLRLVPNPGRITSGSIRLGGTDLMTLNDAELRHLRLTQAGMIFQDAGSYLNPIMTIGEQIAEAIGKRGSRDPADRAKVLEALRAVQIADPARVADAYPHELSGGMQQRAMIAAVLIREPNLILADEPTTALDATVQHQILRFLATLRSKIDATLILISHDLAVVSEVCDRVYVMYGGQIVEEGPTAEIFADPKHPYTRALVDAILDPFDPKTELRPLEGSPPDMADPPTGCRFHPRCSSAFAGCSSIEPDMFSFGTGRMARCRLYSENKNSKDKAA
jgi:oligopeptide/dipeptide ABC transporter ATP-binding protein